METKKSNEETIHAFIEKFSGCTIQQIEAGTGIFKLSVHKSLKKLTENGQVTANKETTPPTYTLSGKSDKTIKKVTEKKETISKADDEVALPKTGGRDTSKYIVNKVAMPKSRAVLESIKLYVKDHPRVSLKTLQELYKSEKLQKRYGTIVELNHAKKFAVSTGRPRHFENDILIVGGKKVVVSNQWNSELFEEFRKISASLKYPIKKQS